MSIGRFAGQNLIKAFKLGAPNMADVAMNAFPALLYGGSMMAQGANPMEALGVAGVDMGYQMGADVLLGTLGARLGMKFAPQKYKDLAQAGGKYGSRQLDKAAQRWAGPAKMGSMATMFLPNPVTNSVYERLQQQQVDPMQVASQGTEDPMAAYTNELAAGVSPDEDEYTRALMAQLAG
jgi:hypothetical protein